MATGADNKKTFLFLEKLSRFQRKLLPAFTVILVVVFIGLAFLLSQFIDFTSRTSKQFSASTARDTLVPEGYRLSLSVYRIGQEVYSNPTQRNSRQLFYQRSIDSLEQARQHHLALLAYATGEERGSLLAEFNKFWSSADVLIARTGHLLNESRSSNSTDKAQADGLKDVFFSADDKFSQTIRTRFDGLLSAELRENASQIWLSSQRVEQIGYRWFFIAFLLFGLGATIAFIITRPGKHFQEGTRRFQTLLDYSINPILIVSPNGSALYANPAYERWSGLRWSELIGRPAFAEATLLNQSKDGEDF